MIKEDDTVGDFQQFVADVTTRLSAMSKGELYVVGDGLDRDSLWLTFLDSFPAGTNLRFRERSEYDCLTPLGWTTCSGWIAIVRGRGEWLIGAAPCKSVSIRRNSLSIWRTRC